MPKISIIIPVFNKAAYLPACLDSVLAQTLDDIEVICVDNNSTDGSLRILEQRAQTDGRIKVVEERRQGPSHARNAGVAKAGGAFVGFLDADDFIDCDYYERLLQASEAHDADIALCGFDHYYPATNTFHQAILPSPSPVFIPRDIGPRVFWTTTPSVCTKIFKRSSLEEAGLAFNTSLAIAEDTLFSYEAVMRAGSVAVIPEPLYHYRQDVAGQLTDSASNSGVQIFEALALLESRIASMEDHASFAEGLVNYSCEGTRYVLSISQTFSEYETIFDTFKSTWAQRVAELPEDALHPEIVDFWRRYRKASCPADLLHKEMVRTSALVQEGEARARLLEAELGHLTAEMDALQRSTMLRVGKAVTTIPRALKDTLRGQIRR